MNDNYIINVLKGTALQWDEYESYFEFNEKIASALEQIHGNFDDYTGSIALIEKKIVLNTEWQVETTSEADKAKINDLLHDVLHNSQNVTYYFLAFQFKDEALRFKLSWMI